MAKFRVQRADACIWLLDERSGDTTVVEVHMVPDQARKIGEALIAAADHKGPDQFPERVIG